MNGTVLQTTGRMVRAEARKLFTTGSSWLFSSRLLSDIIIPSILPAYALANSASGSI